jgi:dipeptidyl aminopeptidase/acylaminoacyl peptidase
MNPRLSFRVAAVLFVAGSLEAAAQTKAPARGAKAAAAAVSPAPPKRPLAHRDYDAWRTIATPTLSRDGRYLAYSYMPEEGDGDLVVRDLKTGKEQRYGVGALPPPPLPDPDANPDAPPPVRNVRISFTGDSRYVICTTYPLKADTDRAKKEKKKPEEMPKRGLVIVDLSTSASTPVESVRSVQVPSRAGDWIAYSKESKEAAAPARPGVTGKEYGTDLVVRDLMSGQERTFPSVLEYAVARDGKTLLFAVSSKTETENGVFAMNAGARQETPIVLASGPGRYLKVTWDREQKRAAFVSDRDDAAAKAPKFKAYLWDRGPSAASVVLDSQTPGMPATLAVSDKGQLAFSRDGKRLYVPAAPPARARLAEADDTPADEKVLVDIWNYKDDLVQPMQRIRAAQERARTYRGVYQIDEKRYAQVGDTGLRTVVMTDDGTHAVGLDDGPYRRMIDFDGAYSDVYLVDGTTGQRKLVEKKWRGDEGGFGGPAFQWSPSGEFAVFFADRHWHALSAKDGSVRNLTRAVPTAFCDERHDSPEPPPSYGASGWTKDSASFLAYDRFDVWQLFLDARPAKSLTGGEGRRARMVYRIERTDPVDEEDAERGIDPGKPLILRGEDEVTRATGFYRGGFEGPAAPVRLTAADRNYRFAGRAKDADVFLVTAQRFDEFPDVHVTDSTFKTLTRVTNGGEQMAPFTWGKAELVGFRNSDGVALQAGLIKPEGFDPKKKYPMIVYIYERLSQGLHTFVAPAPGTSINFAYYASNGYLILTPDIVYTLGQPGQDALKSVLPAIQAVVDRGFVDEANIGIQGHSWGGYQIAYMLTQTSRFKAAEAGAPVGNMTSAYSGIRWGSGLPRQFQYEQTQSRIGPSLYDAPLKYVANSPIFQIKRVTTPVLIIANDNDDAVPWYQGIEYFLALRRNEKEAYLFSYNGEYHGLRKRHNQKDYTVRMQQFFDHFLKGAPKPEWMEKGVPYIEREEEKERFLKGVYRP